MDTITIFNQQRDQQNQLLSKFTTYEPFTGDQTSDVIKFAFANPERLVFSLNQSRDIDKLDFESLYDLTRQRIGRFGLIMNVTEFNRHHRELAIFQSWVMHNEIDGIIFNIDYSLQSIFTAATVLQPFVELIVKWRKQTEQLIGVSIPIIIATNHDPKSSSMRIEDQRYFDALIVNIFNESRT